MALFLKLLGFTAPFAYAAAVYGLFLFLERNASPAARRTVSDWLKGETYTKEHVSNIAVYVFDRLYHADARLRADARVAAFARSWRRE
jgi:hypothetical protein